MRRLISGTTYWNKGKDDFHLPPLTNDLETDVLIIGAGMSGTLCAYVLSQVEGLRITMVDTLQVAEGSSSANTGLLQVSSDTMLHEFMETIGEDKARGFLSLIHI